MERRTFIFGGLGALVSGCARPRREERFETLLKDKDSLLYPPLAESTHLFYFPDLDVWQLDGRIRKLSSFYHGKPLLLHAAQYGCSPCKESFPILNELVSEIEVLGLYCGWGDDFATDRREWLEDTQRLHMDFPTVLVAHRRDTHRGNILLDKFTREQFSKSFESFPSYFIIDSSGMCTHYQSGGLDFQDNGLRLKNAVKRVV